MNTRRFIIISGIGLTFLAGGCALDPRFDSQPARRRFEVSSTGGSDSADVTPLPRPRPEAEDNDTPVEAAPRRRRAAPAKPAPAEAPEPSTATTPPAPSGDPTFIGPDIKSSNTPNTAVARPASAVVQPPSPPPVPEEARATVDVGPSVANQPQQVVHPPVAAPVTLSPQIPTPYDPASPSLTGGISVTADADPDPLGHKFTQRLHDYPNDVSAHFDYQMLRFVRDEPVPQLDALSTLPGEDRELVSAVMDGLNLFRLGLRANGNMLLSKKVKPILDLADRVRSQTELTIPTIAICSRVQGFGVYDPMSTSTTSLHAGVDNTVIIYCEVGNFSSQQNDKGMWETKLSQEAVLYTDSGYPAWKDKSDIPLDLSRNRRHDFFVVKKVILPRTLNVGRYQLKVSILDEQVKPRIAENSVWIELIAQ
jgi:hypothetical protein